MHHRAVAISLNVGLKALMRTAPTHLANLEGVATAAKHSCHPTDLKTKRITNKLTGLKSLVKTCERIFNGNIADDKDRVWQNVATLAVGKAQRSKPSKVFQAFSTAAVFLRQEIQTSTEKQGRR